MGYFSKRDILNEENYNDREDIGSHITEKMIKIIMQAFPEKSYSELFELSKASLRGLYGQAKRKLKSLNVDVTIDGLEEYEDYRR